MEDCRAAELERKFFAEIFSSIIVFHCPHAEQRPSHFGESAPQLVQYHIDFILVAIFECRLNENRYYFIVRRRNSARVIAVAVPTFKDSEVCRLCGNEGISNR